MGFPDQVFLETQTTCDHDLAILGQSFAYGAERLLDRGIDEAAGVDDNEVGAGVVRRGDITLGPQLGEDALRVYKCLGTAEGNKPDLGRGRGPVLLAMAFYPNRLAEGIPGTESP